jgi:hypothetical protein
MSFKHSRIVQRASIVAAVLALGVASPVLAGLLNGNANAFNDGNGNIAFAGAWTGSTHYHQGTLDGDIEYAVFAPGVVPAGLSGGAYAGYTPTAGEFTYTYQVLNSGGAPFSRLQLLLFNQADNIGDFTNLAGTHTTSYTPPTPGGGEVDWFFSSGIPSGGNSDGLIFSSSKVPIFVGGAAYDTGQIADVIPIPSPGDAGIPEPHVLSLLALGMILGRRRNMARIAR